MFGSLGDAKREVVSDGEMRNEKLEYTRRCDLMVECGRCVDEEGKAEEVEIDAQYEVRTGGWVVTVRVDNEIISRRRKT